MKIVVESSHKAVVIRIDERLHLHLLKSQYVGLTSWRQNDAYFAIEITVARGSPILLEYDDEIKWTTVLKGLENVLNTLA